MLPSQPAPAGAGAESEDEGDKTVVFDGRASKTTKGVSPHTRHLRTRTPQKRPVSHLRRVHKKKALGKALERADRLEARLGGAAHGRKLHKKH